MYSNPVTYKSMNIKINTLHMFIVYEEEITLQNYRIWRS